MSHTRYLLLLCLASFVLPASAVEPLSTEVLLNQCAKHEKDTASLDTARCRSYLQGFLGSAYAMRTVKIIDPEKKKTAFIERAERTRLGGIDQRFGMNRQAGYCVPQELTISEFVMQLNRFAAGSNKHSNLANQFVLDFLRAEFACEKAKG